MSIEIMNRVLECDAFKESSHKFVLFLLANCANGEGFCYPSRGYLAKRSLLSEDTVSRAITQLCVDGHLTEHKRSGRNSTFTVHPNTLRTMRGVTPPTSQGGAAAANEDPASVAPGSTGRSPKAAAPVQTGAQIAAAAASNLSTNPPHHAGGSCGQAIHSSPHHAGTPSAPCGDTPRTMRDESSENHQRTSETAPDDLKKSLPEKISEKTKRTTLLEQRQPTPAELERSRIQQMQKIEQALQARGAHA